MKRATAALFSWSLRADCTATTPHVVRGAFALFVLMSVSAAYADAFSAVGPGLRFFGTICYLNVFLITVAGMSYFVSAVTEEKESGTLALLRLAGAPPLGIVLSKSTSRLISALMLMMIQLPFTFLSVTLGGITWFQILAAYAALTGWLCLVSSTSLLCSVTSPTSGRAATRAIAVLLLFFAIGPSAEALSKATLPRWVPAEVPQTADTVAELHQLISVTPRLQEVLSPAGVARLTSSQFWLSMSIAVGLFALSVLLFQRSALPAAPSLTSRSRRIRRMAVSRTWRLFVVWKDFLFFTGGVPGVIGRCLLYGGVVATFVTLDAFSGRQPGQWLSNNDLAWTCFLIIVGVLTVEGLFYATGMLVHESEQGTLGPLRLVPCETLWILAQKLAACAIAMMPGLLALGSVLLLNGPAIFYFIETTGVIWYLFEFLLCAHLTVLLSLRSRWAALPIALFITAASNLCFPVIIISFTTAVKSMARINGMQLGDVTITLINIAWAWVFVLLPLEIETVKAWHRAAEES